VRKPVKFSRLVNGGALLLFMTAVVALLLTQRKPAESVRAPASISK